MGGVRRIPLWICQKYGISVSCWESARVSQEDTPEGSIATERALRRGFVVMAGTTWCVPCTVDFHRLAGPAERHVDFAHALII